MKRIFVCYLILNIILTGGCQITTKTTSPTEQLLQISASASLKDALGEAKNVFERENSGVKLKINFASAGTLKYQIEQGAPVDLFISAGEEQIEELLKQGLIDDPVIVAGNRLVLVVLADTNISLMDLKEITKSEFGRVAIGSVKTVPAGKYAEEAMRKAGIYEVILPKLIFAKDVRQVLSYVETGNVDAGFVYNSDAITSKRLKTYVIPANFHKPIVYPAAVLKEAKNRELAQGFLAFLQEKEVKKIFKTYGFSNI